MCPESSAQKAENSELLQSDQKPRFTREQILTPLGGFTEFGSNAFKFIGFVIPQLLDLEVSEARKLEVFEDFLQLSEKLGLKKDGQVDIQAIQVLAKIIYEITSKSPSSKAVTYSR